MPQEDPRKKIFGEVLEEIKLGLRSGKLKAGRAREIARFVLNSLGKEISPKEIFAKVPTFKNQYPELAVVSLGADLDYEKLIKERITPQAQKLISENRFSEANDLIKKAFNKEIDL